MTISKTIIAVAILTTGLAAGALAPVSPENLKKSASHIVVGTVEKVVTKFSRPAFGLRNRDYKITLRIESVEKGAGLKKAETVVVHAWRPARSWRIRPPGPQGHYNIPKKGEKVRVFVRKDVEAYQVIMPNGFSPMKEG